MKSETAMKIAKGCSDAEVQKWASAIGWYVALLSPQLLEAERKMCGECPFRNNITAGGCCTEDCPIHNIRHAFNRAIPRGQKAVKEICKARWATDKNRWWDRG